MPLRRATHERDRFRFRPRDGEPRCFLEQVAQHIWKNPVQWYIAVGVTTIGVVALLQYLAGLHS
jgi:hypothetical protein